MILARKHPAIERMIKCIRSSSSTITPESILWLRARLLHAEFECGEHAFEARSVCIGIHRPGEASELLDFNYDCAGAGSLGLPAHPHDETRHCVTLLVVAYDEDDNEYRISHDETLLSSVVGSA